MRRLTLQQAIVASISQEMQRDTRVFHIGQSIGSSFNGSMSSTKGLGDEFGTERVIDTPMSELAMVGAAVGAAISGTRPIVQVMFSEFLSLVMSPLACDAATIHYRSGGKACVPLVVRTLFGAGPHRGHPEDFHSWAASVPGLKVIMPSTPRDAKGLMTSAIRDDNPVLFMEHMGLYHGAREAVPEEEFTIPLGVADIKRAGRDVTVVAIGMLVPLAIKVAEALRSQSVDVEVIDLRTVVPLDKDTVIASVAKTGRLVVASETWSCGDSMAEVMATVAEALCTTRAVPMARVGVTQVPRPFAMALERMTMPNEEKLVCAIMHVMNRPTSSSADNHGVLE
jgi:pyruvate/2-oxoglutarate/acetoin dehydrogenase E1 component